MRHLITLGTLTFLAAAVPAHAQLPRSELEARVEEARHEGDAQTLLRGVAAARLLGDHAASFELLEQADAAIRQLENALVNEMILRALAAGEGVNGMQRAFRKARERVQMSPREVAGVANNFPELLIGGELDRMILSFSLDHPDPDYRCACLAEKAWVHRIAMNTHQSRTMWGELVAAWDRNPVQFEDSDAQAEWQGQYARNLARAGRRNDAVAELEEAMAMPVSAEALPSIQRRWAQTYAELGDVEKAVALLEPLLEQSTLVTVHSLSARYTWEPVRSDIAFQQMLARHR